MKSVIAILVFVLIATIELTLLDTVTVLSVKPALFLIAVVYMSLFWGRRPAMLFGFASGIFLDLYGPRNMGLNSLLLLTTGFLVGTLAASLYREKYASQVLLLFLTSIAEAIAYFALSSGSPAAFFLFFVRYGVLTALYTTVVGSVIFFAFHLGRKRLGVT